MATTPLGKTTDGRALSYDAALYEFVLDGSVVPYADVKMLDSRGWVRWRADVLREWFRRIVPADLQTCHERAQAGLTAGAQAGAGDAADVAVQASGAQAGVSACASEVTASQPAIAVEPVQQADALGADAGAHATRSAQPASPVAYPAAIAQAQAQGAASPAQVPGRAEAMRRAAGQSCSQQGFAQVPGQAQAQAQTQVPGQAQAMSPANPQPLAWGNTRPRGVRTVAQGGPSAGQGPVAQARPAARSALAQPAKSSVAVAPVSPQASSGAASSAMKSFKSKDGKLSKDKSFSLSSSLSGEVVFQKVEGDAGITVKPRGKVVAEKGLATGAYAIEVQAVSMSDAATETIQVTVRVK